MEKPFRANEQKQDRLAPTWGGDSTVMTSAWSRAVAMLALAQQIQKSRSGRLRCLCLWSQDPSSERALRISTRAHRTAGRRQLPIPQPSTQTHHPSLQYELGPRSQGKPCSPQPGTAAKVWKGGFNLILSWQPGENRTQRVTHFISKPVPQGRRSGRAGEGVRPGPSVHGIARCLGWWHLPWHTLGSSTPQAWLLEEK